MLISLLNWGEARIDTLVELAVDVWFVNRLILLAFLLKICIHLFNFLSIGYTALLSQLRHSSCIWHSCRRGVIGVSVSNWQEVIVIKNNSSFLHNSEGAKSARLLNIPHHFIVNTLQLWKKKLRKAMLRLTLRMPSMAFLRSAVFSLPSPSLSKSFEMTRSLLPTIPSPSRSKLIWGTNSLFLLPYNSVSVRLRFVLSPLFHQVGILDSSLAIAWM